MAGANEQGVEYYAILRDIRYPVRQLKGSEHVSKPFRFTAELFTTEGYLLDPDQLVGTPAALEIEREGQVVRRLNGIATEVWLRGTSSGFPLLNATIEPHFKLLDLCTDCRVFRDKTAVDIVKEVLEARGVGVELRLRGSYYVRPYTVQFRESTLNFVERLLEEEGIFYFFPDVLGTDDADVTRVVLGDDVSAHQPIIAPKEVIFRPGATLKHDNIDTVVTLSRRMSMGPSKVTLRDWNLEHPSLNMDVESPGPFDGGPEHYDYPGRYGEPGLGQHRADMRAQAFVADAHRIRGRSDASRLAAGRTFVVEEAPPGLDEELVIVSLTHDFKHKGLIGEGEEDAGSGFAVDFDAVPTSIPFRPLPDAEHPLLTNPFTGIVTGPEGEDIHTDEYGRVKVSFPWDRFQKKDDQCSHWIPVLQDNTGHSSAIPRVGWEVVVAFVEGDPDRPYVLGRTYNTKDPFPEPLPANKTKTALRSLTSPSRGGHNEIWIEDKAGAELVSLQAEKDMNVVVANDKIEDVLNDEENTIVKDETITVGNNQTVHSGDAEIVTVEGNQVLTVGANRTRKVGASEQVSVDGNRSVTIGASHTRIIGGNDNVALDKTLTETIGAVDVETSYGENSTTASQLNTLTVGGAVVEMAGEDKSETTEMLRAETVGVGIITNCDKMEVKAGAKRTTDIGGVLKVVAAIAKYSAAMTIKATIGTATKFTGSKGIVIKSGDSEVNLTSSGITMSAKKITLEATGKHEIKAPKANLN